MKTGWLLSGISAFFLAAVLAAPAVVQQRTGSPGSPGATTTIDGRYLPPPPQQLHGDIPPNAYQSKQCDKQ